jgi:hypothetical protein
MFSSLTVGNFVELLRVKSAVSLFKLAVREIFGGRETGPAGFLGSARLPVFVFSSVDSIISKGEYFNPLETFEV